jgi:hypothetical protein
LTTNLTTCPYGREEDAFHVCVMTEAVNHVAKRYRELACTADARAVPLSYSVQLLEGKGDRKVNAGFDRAP